MMSARNSPQEAKLLEFVQGVERTIPSLGFGSSEEFNAFCSRAVTEWNDRFPGFVGETPTFPDHLRKIESAVGNIIKTPWGGVDISLRDDPKVEKYLVVRGGRYLAYEKHSRKEEEMEGREGYGLLLLVDAPGSRPNVHLMSPGKTVQIRPEHEHCLIALTNLLVFERSLDHLGMDKDLIFIHLPE
jgi:hypothetical protein